MKKIKFLLLAMVAAVVGMGFSACGDDDNNDTSSNYERYQKTVNETVNSQKKSDKVILLVAFGSTWQQAYDTFETITSEYKAKFPGWDVYLSFSSAICITKAREGEHVASRDYFSPEHWLTAIGLAGYKQIIVQSLQVIPGEEYHRVRDTYVKNFMNNHNGDFTDAYMKSIDKEVVLGTPLMAEESDAANLATVLNNESDVKAAVSEGIVAFMGHGNPEGYDYYGGNIRYLQLEEYLRNINENYYVGTVDMAETYVSDVLSHINGGTFNIKVGDMTKTMTYAKNNSKKAQLYPLMSIAGDHAHNDMADPDDEESWYSTLNSAGIKTTAYETNYTAACLKTYKTGDEYIPALGERAAVRALWMKHTQEAISKLGTDEAMSTPTTAAE